MPLTHAQVKTRLEEVLWDTADTYWDDTRISSKILSVLKELSLCAPFSVGETHTVDRTVPILGKYTTDGTTRDIILTDWDFDDLVKISQEDGVEYPVDESPKQYRNHVQRGKTVRLELDDIPDADEDVYIYPSRQHILQSSIGTTDTAAAVKTTAAIGATSLVLNALGTGTINRNTKLTIAGDTTEYMVTASVTIATNEATVVITPGLIKSATATAIVTLALADSTLTPALEEILIKWVAGELLSDYAIKMLPLVPKGAGHADYTRKGELMIAQAKSDLRLLERPDRYVRHPRT